MPAPKETNQTVASCSITVFLGKKTKKWKRGTHLFNKPFSWKPKRIFPRSLPYRVFYVPSGHSATMAEFSGLWGWPGWYAILRRGINLFRFFWRRGGTCPRSRLNWHTKIYFDIFSYFPRGHAFRVEYPCTPPPWVIPTDQPFLC